LGSSPPRLDLELSMAKKLKELDMKNKVLSKRLDVRLDRHRGVYIDGFSFKTKRWR
jgi:hypothetical protein